MGALVLPVVTAQAVPGGHTQAQVNTSVAKGVAYLDSKQNGDGSFGTTSPVAETGMSLLAYGVLANGNFASLSAAYQSHVKKAITYLLGKQDTTAGILNGSWAPGEFIKTDDTSIALSGLSSFKTVDAGIPGAITKGRAFLVAEFQSSPFETCSSADPPDSTAGFCGGWNYEPDPGRSDESNTGFAMTGLQLSGGVPPSVQSVDIGWQHHVQEITGNPFATRNDGGGGYEPGINNGSFASNANDTGSMLFSLGFDGVAASDAHVQAGLKLANDILNVYELAAPANHVMVFHTGVNEDGACNPTVAGCDWSFGSGEGGFHYSIFTLTKGLGEFIAPSLTDATNWYAKVVDLLLNQQATDGSWPADLRDDASTVFATALSVSSLGLVAVPPTTPNPCTPTPTDAHHVITGHVSSSLTLSGGSWSVTKATVGGAILVTAGTSVVVGDSSVAGSISVGKGAKVAVCGSRVNGSLVASSQPAGVAVCSSTLGGAITVMGSTKFVLIGDPTDDTCGTNMLTSAGANNLVGNTAGIEVASNRISGSLNFNSNSGKGPFAEDTGPEIEGNTIGGSLRCSANTPAPINDGKPNTVGGSRSGQCTGSF